MTKNGVFISHITQERPLALLLQRYLRLAFGDDLRVFVSSDAKSIGGGEKYTHIIENLRLSKVVLVLVSQESKGKEWINFEAGFGEGSESRVIPVGVRSFPIGQLSFPLAGLQGRSIDDIGAIIDDVAGQVGASPNNVDAKAYLGGLEDAEAQLVYKHLTVEPVVANGWLMFDIQNVGSVDLELLMLEWCLPRDVFEPGTRDSASLYGDPHRDVSSAGDRGGRPYVRFACYSARGTYSSHLPALRPVITPSMGKVRPRVETHLRLNLSSDERALPMFYQIHAIGYRTEEEQRRLGDLLA